MQEPVPRVNKNKSKKRPKKKMQNDSNKYQSFKNHIDIVWGFKEMLIRLA